MKRRPSQGFTLVELMTAVVIITVLSVLAWGAFHRFTARARATEVYAMFAEIRAKEESYRAEFNAYLSVSTSDTDFYPVLGSGGPEPAAKTWAPTNALWNSTTQPSLGVNPPRTQLFCGYSVVAAAASSWGTAADTQTQAFLQNTPPAVNWWVALAMCDNDGVAGTFDSGNNATYITSSRSTAVTEENPAR